MPPADGDGDAATCKRRRLHSNSLDEFPDDLLLLILGKLSSSSSRPSDLLSVLLTCRRLNRLARCRTILLSASPGALAVPASRWCGEAHTYLRRCADLGNPRACYALGMIMFYCLGYRKAGISMMAKAAISHHAEALYSLAVIYFNGSGTARSTKAINVAVVLCTRAALLGHVDALREIGHCLQDGYGVLRDTARGRQYLVNANVKEIAAALGSMTPSLPPGRAGWILQARRANEVSQFMLEWFGALGRGCGDGELRMCSQATCGRRELNRHEFRRCSACGEVNYCSRACQFVDWRQRHKVLCRPRAQPVGDGDGGGAARD